MGSKIPQLKKKISAFLVGEEGKISKKSLIKTGSFLTLLGLGSILAAKSASGQVHSNSLSVSSTGSSATSQHSHHVSHASHASHGSHGSHGSHSSY